MAVELDIEDMPDEEYLEHAMVASLGEISATLHTIVNVLQRIAESLEEQSTGRRLGALGG